MVTRKFNVADMAEILDNVRPFTVGFDRMFNNLENVSEIASNYPPYNIVKTSDEEFVIEIAAAGFAKDEFNIHIVPEGKKLVVRFKLLCRANWLRLGNTHIRFAAL